MGIISHCFGTFCFSWLPDRPICKIGIPDLLPQKHLPGLCTQGTVSPLSKSVRDARWVAFYLVHQH